MSDWNLELTTPPAVEPLSLDEARDHLRLDTDHEDPLIDALILVAREYVENYTSRALLTQTRKLRLTNWPRHGRIYLPRPPLQSVTSITYLEAAAGASTTLSTSAYSVYNARTTPDADAPLGYIEPAYGQSWPSLWPVPNAITVTYVCGWLTAGAIPRAIQHAMLVALADLYERRETVITGTIIGQLPTIERLLVDHVVRHDFGVDC